MTKLFENETHPQFNDDIHLNLLTCQIASSYFIGEDVITKLTPTCSGIIF